MGLPPGLQRGAQIRRSWRSFGRFGASGPRRSNNPGSITDRNGVVLDVDLCYYGSTVDLGRIVTSDPEATIAELRGTTGTYAASDGGLGVPSVRLVLPGGASGAVRLLFVHEGQRLTVALNGPDDGRSDQLAGLLLSR